MNTLDLPPDAASAGAAPAGSAAQRSLKLLALVAGSDRPLALAEIAAGLDLPKGTAHRLCMQLADSGHLARDLGDATFAAGPALRRLAFDTLNHDTRRGLRHAVLTDLVAQLGETCNLTTLDRDRVVYLDRVEAQWPLRLTLDIGVRVPLHCTASGKLFLAEMPAAERATVLAHLPLPALTRRTLVTPADLMAECETIAASGHACDREEFVAGLIAVAVPVRDVSGRLRATLAVHAPVARLSLDAALARLGALHASAVRMGELL